METIKKITEIDPRDLPIVERLFGQRLEGAAAAVLILKTSDTTPNRPADDADAVPSWCNVLDGLSDEDLADFNATLNLPVHFGRPS
jgi:hypothetical protein